MPRRVTITGPRNLGEVSNADLGGLFDAYLRPFAGGAAHFYLGGAAGIDTAALAWLAEHTNVGLTVVVPCALVDQPAIAVETVNRWRKRVDEVVELQALELGTVAYHARNRWMVDRSELVIGFPRGTDPASGTWYTLNYAAEQGKARLVIPL
ncbi:hypothetical protein GCM10025787_29690 [Saccharopolyspora rosea]|uniref:DNA recombination-mediator protein A n=1 Tax=Saccharopolyspora rosea TaxID=524884 RepID=A0ABW3G4W2_9PSEU